MTAQIVMWTVVGLLLLRAWRARRRRLQLLHPLAGIDTGTRFAWRAPRRVRFHRGF